MPDTPESTDENFFEEDLLADDSRPSPQLWGEDSSIPDMATPVNEKRDELPRHAEQEIARPGYKRKTKARELALQMLFQADVNSETPEQDIADQLRDRLPEADMFQFAWDIYLGVLREKESLDKAISATATNWKLSRMAVTDRNVLRLGAYELNHVDTPYGVVLDEAIDMAKKFGTNHSASFVNGVLDKLVPESKRPEGSSRPSEAASSNAATTSDRSADFIHARSSPEDVAAKSKGSPIAFRRKKDESQDASADGDPAG